MSEGLFDRYFRLLSGRLPEAEYGVIVETEESQSGHTEVAEAANRGCLC